MSLATYTDLLAAIPNWLARPGDAFITAVATDLVTLCEARMAFGAPDDSPFPTRPLRIRAMETSRAIPIQSPTSCGTATGTGNAIVLTPTTPVAALVKGLLVNWTALADNTGATTLAVSGLGATPVVIGSASLALGGGEIAGGSDPQAYYDGSNFVLLPDAASAPLPPDFLAARAFYVPGQPRRDLDYVTPDQLNDMVRWDTVVDQPKRYTIEADAFRFDPQPDASYFPWLLYYKRLPALVTAAGATNWLMTNAPNVYLFGCLLEAAIYTGADEQMTKWGSLFRAACDGVATADTTDRHAGGALVMRNASGNP